MKENNDIFNKWLNRLNNSKTQIDGAVSPRQIFSTIWSNITAIFAAFVAISIIGFLLIGMKPDYYRSSALLVPSKDSASNASGLGSIGGVAALAGINIGSGTVSDVDIAIETLKSRDFILNFIENHGLKANIVAAKRWNEDTGKLEYIDSIYVEEAGGQLEFVGNPEFYNDSFVLDEFSKMFSLKQSPDKGFVQLSFVHKSPVVAEFVLDAIIKDINSVMRDRAIAESNKNIKYLEKKISEVAYSELREVFYSLIEEQIKNSMIAETRTDYVFSIIDSPYTPDEAAGPQRILFGLIIGLLAVLLYIAILLIRSYVLPQASSR